MPARSANLSPRRWSNGLPGALVALCALAVLLVACGIRLHSAEHETELFKRLTVDGELVPGGRVTFHLAYEQPYSVNVTVSCVLVARGGQEMPPEPPVEVSTPDPGATPTPLAIPAPVPTPKHRVLDILSEVLDPNPGDAPPGEATPAPGTIDGAFRAPEAPGRYAVYCYTPADANNVITKEFSINAS